MDSKHRTISFLDVADISRWLRSDSAANSAADLLYACVHRLDRLMVSARRAVEKRCCESTEYACENQSL